MWGTSGGGGLVPGGVGGGCPCVSTHTPRVKERIMCALFLVVPCSLWSFSRGAEEKEEEGEGLFDPQCLDIYEIYTPHTYTPH